MRPFPHSARGGSAAALAATVALVSASTAQADIRIAFTGMNLVYDGSSLYDAGSSLGGVFNPAQADPLTTVDFYNDDVHVGALTSDVSLDVLIGGIENIPAAPNTSYSTLATPNYGFFDLLIGTSPLAAGGLAVNIQSVSVTYTDIAGVIEFVFAGGIGSIYDQALPFGLVAADPVTISLSAQVNAASLTSDDGIITGFEAFGTGEYRAAAVPTPGALALCSLGALTVARRRRAR